MNAGAVAGRCYARMLERLRARLWMMHGHLLLNWVAGKQVLVVV